MTGIGKQFFDTGLTKGSVYCSSPAFMHKQAQLACDNGGIMARRSGRARLRHPARRATDSHADRYPRALRAPAAKAQSP
jgi:hypothetical protein